uniref:Cytochrome P450 n=1 Tax=Chenopodium quinoa TaxID=63459 RepID=A0A803M7X3_CHEQI
VGLLLEHTVGNLDPLHIVNVVPYGLEIPRLRNRLVKIITDYRTETSLRHGCNDILKADIVNLLVKYYKEARHAVYMNNTEDEATTKRDEKRMEESFANPPSFKNMDLKTKTSDENEAQDGSLDSGYDEFDDEENGESQSDSSQMQWDEPNMFKPERFANETEVYKFFPFEIGRRSCRGSAFATRNITLVLATLIQCFDWETLEDGVIDFTMKSGANICPEEKPLEVICHLRFSMVDVFAQLNVN